MSEQTGNPIPLQDMTLEQLLAKAKQGNHPWLPAIGIFEEGNIFDQWQQVIADYRASLDKDCIL